VAATIEVDGCCPAGIGWSSSSRPGREPENGQRARVGISLIMRVQPVREVRRRDAAGGRRDLGRNVGGDRPAARVAMASSRTTAESTASSSLDVS
jgi:hypothetical protein